MTENNFMETLVKRVWPYIGMTLVTAGVGYASLFAKGLKPENAFGRLSLAQALILLVAFVVFIRIKSPRLLYAEEVADSPGETTGKAYRRFGYCNDHGWDEAKSFSEKSLEQFKSMWLFALGAWALLYFVFFVSAFYQEQPAVSVILNIISDMLNVGSHGAIVACYIVLAKDTNNPDTHPLAWSFLVVIIGAGELLAIVPYLGTNITPPKLLIDACGVVIGCVGGMVLGLLVGQLDNEHLAAPVWLLTLLFGYAAIQPLYPVIHGTFTALGPAGDPSSEQAQLNEIVKQSPTILICIAGLLKLLLCVFLYISFKHGRLLFYFTRKRTITESVGVDWADFDKMMKKRGAAQTKEGAPVTKSTEDNKGGA